MRIGELAKRTGVATRMLRYYEEQGLISTRRLDNGYRGYDEYEQGQEQDEGSGRLGEPRPVGGAAQDQLGWDHRLLRGQSTVLGACC